MAGNSTAGDDVTTEAGSGGDSPFDKANDKLNDVKDKLLEEFEKCEYASQKCVHVTDM